MAEGYRDGVEKARVDECRHGAQAVAMRLRRRLLAWPKRCTAVPNMGEEKVG